MITWNPLVNTRISLDESYRHKGGYVQTLQFTSGKHRTYLTNSYVPLEYPSLRLALDNRCATPDGRTEYEEFKHWYEVTLRYGVLPFSLPRLGYRPKWYIKEGEIGVYTFIPESLEFDTHDGIIFASFGLEEAYFIPEVSHIFLVTDKGEFFITDKKEFIVVNPQPVERIGAYLATDKGEILFTGDGHHIVV